MSVEIGAVVVCDDIRREGNGKDILIGAYAGEIIFPELPASLGLSAWIELKSPDPVITMWVRLSFNGEVGATVKMVAQNPNPKFLAFVLPGFQMTFASEGDLVLEYSENQDDWVELKRKRVMRGKVTQIFDLKKLSEEKPSPSS